MQIYRPLTAFKLISFDLDDTLYDNRPVILAAEQAFLERLAQISQIPSLSPAYWQDWKQKVALSQPLLAEDVVQWRAETLRQLLSFYQKSTVEIENIIADCLQHFVLWRHKITVPPPHSQLLDKLAQHYPLVALTNGNVEPQKIGLNQFSLVLRGGEQGRAKPHKALFHRACQHFTIHPQQMLHIGDNLITDVQGAIQAGCQAAWLNLSPQQGLKAYPEARLLPHIELHQLTELSALIKS